MKYMKVLVHQQPYKEILRSFGLEKLFSLRWSPSSWFLLGLICLWIATLEVVLPNHTWNMIMSSKPCFVIIKIKINQTLVSYNLYIAVNLQTCGHINVVTLIFILLWTFKPMATSMWLVHSKIGVIFTSTYCSKLN